MKNPKLGSALLALGLAAQMAMPMAMAADISNVYDTDGAAESKVVLTVMEQKCEHGDLAYTDNGDGTHNAACGDCKELVVKNERHIDEDDDKTCDECGADMKTDCVHDAWFRDNKDGTHSLVCELCGTVLNDSEPHHDDDFDNKCNTCGADMKAPDPILIANVPLSLPIVMDGEGRITVSSDAAIENLSERSIALQEILVEAADGWECVVLDHDFLSEPEDTHKFAIAIRGNDVKLSGIITGSTADGLRAYYASIAAGDSLKLNMAANLPRQTQAVSDECIATLSFSLGWANSDDEATSSQTQGDRFQEWINEQNGFGIDVKN